MGQAHPHPGLKLIQQDDHDFASGVYVQCRRDFVEQVQRVFGRDAFNQDRAQEANELLLARGEYRGENFGFQRGFAGGDRRPRGRNDSRWRWALGNVAAASRICRLSLLVLLGPVELSFVGQDSTTQVDVMDNKSSIWVDVFTVMVICQNIFMIR